MSIMQDLVMILDIEKKENPALLRNGRVDIKMPIGNMKNFENADMINFALPATIVGNI